MTWTYQASQLQVTTASTFSSTVATLMQTRRLIGDVLTADQQLQDEEIYWSLTRYTTIYGAAAECCRDIAAQFARKVDTVQGELRTLYSAQTKRYADMARLYENRALTGSAPFAGGISASSKAAVAADPDRVPPDFVRSQFDDRLPEAPVGQPTNQTSSPDTGGVE